MLQAVEFFGKFLGTEVLDLVLHWPFQVREIPILSLLSLQDINGVIVRDSRGDLVEEGVRSVGVAGRSLPLVHDVPQV